MAGGRQQVHLGMIRRSEGHGSRDAEVVTIDNSPGNRGSRSAGVFER